MKGFMIVSCALEPRFISLASRTFFSELESSSFGRYLPGSHTRKVKVKAIEAMPIVM